jgi:hypothetical protein
MSKLFTLLIFLSACSGRVVDSRAYDANGELTWSTVMPSSRNTALWLRYTLTAPVARDRPDAEGTIRYELNGHIELRADSTTVYAGSVLLRPEGPTISKSYSKGERDGVSRSCGYSTCTESGRIKLLSLHETDAGAALQIISRMPSKSGEAELIGAQLELAPN